MKSKLIIGGAIVAILAGLLVLRGGSGGAQAHANLPAVFASANFAEAKQLAAASGKPLVVNFSASWCPPCQTMKKNVWTDAKVKDWVDQNAVAVYVDVDRDSETAKKFKVEAMPTMVIVRGEQELARVVGGRTADGLIDWMARSVK